MSHYIYCAGKRSIASGGTVGYLSRLDKAFKEYRSDYRTDAGTEIIFDFIEGKAHQTYINKSLVDFPEMITMEKGDIESWRLKNKCKRWFRELSKGEASFLRCDSERSIHINGVYSFFPIWNRLKLRGVERKTIKILTAHNPMVPFEEELSIRESEGKYSEGELNILKLYMEYRDYLAFHLSDAIICPSVYSLESYERWNKFEEVIKNKPIYYCVTGAPKRISYKSRKEVRFELGIPEDATVILYLGRKEKVKGYDIFESAAKNIMNINSNIWFLVVGSGNLQSSLKHNHFVDVGYSENAGDYIEAADVCVTANRSNYFDLSMIEFLASGKILLLSKVGGNKWLEGKVKGVYFFESENVNDLTRMIRYIFNFSEVERLSMQRENLEFYNRELTLNKFQDNYQKVIDDIRRDVGKEIFFRKEDKLKESVREISKMKESLNAVGRFCNEFLRKKYNISI